MHLWYSLLQELWDFWRNNVETTTKFLTVFKYFLRELLKQEMILSKRFELLLFRPKCFQIHLCVVEVNFLNDAIAFAEGVSSGSRRPIVWSNFINVERILPSSILYSEERCSMFLWRGSAFLPDNMALNTVMILQGVKNYSPYDIASLPRKI